MMLRKNRSKKYYKLTLFIFVFIFLFSIFTPPSQVSAGDIGETCTTFQDCPSNNMCISTGFWGTKKCYPKIGGGCNQNNDCEYIEKHLGIPGAFCSPAKPVTGYPGSCFSNSSAPKTTTEDGCAWRIESPIPGTNGSYQGGCYSNEKREAEEKCQGISKPDKKTGEYLYCCCPAPQKKETGKTPDLNPLGNLQVKIPGLDEIAAKHPIKCEGEEGDQTCGIPWIAIYIHAIYNYLLGIGGILAAIALMVGGVIWLVSAGNASRVSEAKSWIAGSVTGLLILFTSYIILYQINPNLVGLKYIELQTIEPVAGDTTAPSTNGSIGGPFTSSATAEHLKKISIYCPQSGGSKEIKKIAESFKGKVVYRLGSKNGKGDEYNKEKAQEKYGLSCPNNEKWGEPVVCYDCSGFVRQVLWCAGFTKDPGAGTSVIFPGTEKINTCGTVSGNPSINGKILVEGDLVGWYPKGDGSNSGHVLIYIGGGILADTHGNRSYPPAGAYGNFNLCTEVSKRKNELIKSGRDLYIKRIGSY